MFQTCSNFSQIYFLFFFLDEDGVMMILFSSSVIAPPNMPGLFETDLEALIGVVVLEDGVLRS